MLKNYVSLLLNNCGNVKIYFIFQNLQYILNLVNATLIFGKTFIFNSKQIFF